MLEYYAKPINRNKMPRLTGKQVAEFLEKHGWESNGSSGSHFFYSKDGYEDITVPIHNNEVLRTGTQKTIIKSSGIPEEVWLTWRY